jgi:folate-binding protein YgfZ
MTMPPIGSANPLLIEHLRRCGAHIEAGRIQHFGQPEAERSAVLAGVTLHALTDVAHVEVSGEDAQAFLQGQFSNDIDALSATRAQLSTYCTPQGRMLATLLAWRNSGGFVLQLPADLAAPVAARLQRYILRAKVQLVDATARYAVLGLGGPGAAGVLETDCGSAPAEPMARLEFEWGSVLCLNSQLYQLVVNADAAAQRWGRLAALARPAGTVWWEWRLIQAGIPTLTAATQNQFVPQMAGMDTLGAISFDKGCYPGQEIVARAQFRGQVKRRLVRLHAESGTGAGVGIGIGVGIGVGDTAAGKEIFEPPHTAAVGMVVNAAPAPAGGVDLLAVVQIDSAQRGGLRLGTARGPALTLAGSR